LVFWVAEIGSNWEGNVKKAFHTIEQCKEARANAVKFQMWRAKDLYNGKYKKFELTKKKARQIIDYCDLIDIEFFASAFYPEAVLFLERMDVKRYKLASRTMALQDKEALDTILFVEETQKPTTFSNGHNAELISVPDHWKKLYCIPEYPAEPEDIKWEEALKCDGFSDHCLGIAEALKYAKLKPDSIIEKHVKLVNTNSPDSSFSITVQELATLITSSTS